MERLARLQETLYSDYGMYVGHGLVDGRLQIIEVRSVKDGSLVVPDKWAESKAAFKIVEEMKRADVELNKIAEETVSVYKGMVRCRKKSLR